MRPFAASAKRHNYFYYRHPRGQACEECSKNAWPTYEAEEAVLGRLGMLADDGEILDMIMDAANKRLTDGAPVKEAEVGQPDRGSLGGGGCTVAHRRADGDALGLDPGHVREDGPRQGGCAQRRPH